MVPQGLMTLMTTDLPCLLIPMISFFLPEERAPHHKAFVSF